MNYSASSFIRASLIIPVALLFVAAHVHAQSSAAKGGKPTNGALTGLDAGVDAIVVQPDGKILIGGDFTTVRGATRNYLARLNPDGSVDRGFDPGAGADGTVNSIALQNDGKVLVGGVFSAINGIERKAIARLNADGSVDQSFNPGSGPDQPFRVSCLALQTDGKLLICGDFTKVNGVPRNRVARLNSNGSLDVSFDPGTGADKGVYALSLQPDGKVLVGGWFTNFNGTEQKHLARLNINGSVDQSFRPQLNFTVADLALTHDGKILICGAFKNVQGATRRGVARLMADGSLDAGFDPGKAVMGTVRSLAVQSGGKVVIGGWFASINGMPRNRVARLNADGSLDPSFDPGPGANIGFSALAVQRDGKLMVGGAFALENASYGYLARLNADGSEDGSFDAGVKGPTK